MDGYLVSALEAQKKGSKTGTELTIDVFPRAPLCKMKNIPLVISEPFQQFGDHSASLRERAMIFEYDLLQVFVTSLDSDLFATIGQCARVFQYQFRWAAFADSGFGYTGSAVVRERDGV
jgi:hypothetical protein